MAKVQSEIVSGIGANAKRTDLGNVAKIQRQAKIQRASGGAYGERTALTQLAQGAPTSTPEAPMPTVASPQLQNLRSATTKVVPVNELKGAPGEVITDGAPGDTAGRSPQELPAAIGGPDEAAILARALFATNPTPANRRLLEAFIAEGR